MSCFYCWSEPEEEGREVSTGFPDLWGESQPDPRCLQIRSWTLRVQLIKYGLKPLMAQDWEMGIIDWFFCPKSWEDGHRECLHTYEELLLCLIWSCRSWRQALLAFINKYLGGPSIGWKFKSWALNVQSKPFASLLILLGADDYSRLRSLLLIWRVWYFFPLTNSSTILWNSIHVSVFINRRLWIKFFVSTKTF